MPITKITDYNLEFINLNLRLDILENEMRKERDELVKCYTALKNTIAESDISCLERFARDVNSIARFILTPVIFLGNYACKKATVIRPLFGAFYPKVTLISAVASGLLLRLMHINKA